MNPEQEQTSVDRPCGLYQEYVREQIKKIFPSEEILVSIIIDWLGQPMFVKQNWQEYWESVTPKLSSTGLQILDDLRAARHRDCTTSPYPKITLKTIKTVIAICADQGIIL